MFDNFPSAYVTFNFKNNTATKKPKLLLTFQKEIRVLLAKSEK